MRARQGRQSEARIEIVDGFPAVIDELAADALGAPTFLRSAWYEAAADAGRTMIARRPDGRAVAAIPLVQSHLPLPGLSSVPGSYWPFRNILLHPDLGPDDLARIFGQPIALAGLGPYWRVGPLYRDCPSTALLKAAAARAGWTVLARTTGRTWLFDLAAMVRHEAWPRKSTRRRLAAYERQLAREGRVEFEVVSGSRWTEEALDRLAAVEAESWVGRKTDGKGAKFLRPDQRSAWYRATRDPHLAEALSATLMLVGGIPAAFSFDLRAGGIQYSIASSFDQRFAAGRPGKIVTYRQLQWAAGRGVERVDLGAGDSGYKREMGAVPGSEIVDLLIVRSRPAARFLRLRWGDESPAARAAFQPRRVPTSARRRLIRHSIAAGALAAATLALSE